MKQTIKSKAVRSVEVKLSTKQVADASNPFQSTQTQLDILVDGKRLDLPLLQQFTLGMDAQSKLPVITLSFLAPELQLQVDGLTQLIQEEQAPETPS